MKPVTFGIIGGGWRAAFFLRIARALPHHFRVRGMLVRDAAKGEALSREWGLQTYRTLDELMRHADPSFVVVCVPWHISPVALRELAERGIPALAETPPAPDLERLLTLHELVRTGAKIQVAEQYQFQPLHAARIALVQSGKLGTISQVQISVAHGYHGISLMRKLLGIGFEEATIAAYRFASSLVAGPDRDNPPYEERIVSSEQTIATLGFKGKIGIYDFTGDQYFSWIRTPRLLVRGERGEINNSLVSYLADFRTNVRYELQRQNAGEDGNLEGYYLKGILAGSEWIYRNPFIPGRLSDEEIAIATCLEKMAHYVDGGPEFYSLAEAAQDQYLSLMMDLALKQGIPVQAARQPWGENSIE